jgi:hypothetical protein
MAFIFPCVFLEIMQGLSLTSPRVVFYPSYDDTRGHMKKKRKEKCVFDSCLDPETIPQLDRALWASVIDDDEKRKRETKQIRACNASLTSVSV